MRKTQLFATVGGPMAIAAMLVAGPAAADNINIKSDLDIQNGQTADITATARSATGSATATPDGLAGGVSGDVELDDGANSTIVFDLDVLQKQVKAFVDAKAVGDDDATANPSGITFGSSMNTLVESGGDTRIKGNNKTNRVNGLTTSVEGIALAGDDAVAKPEATSVAVSGNHRIETGGDHDIDLIQRSPKFVDKQPVTVTAYAKSGSNSGDTAFASGDATAVMLSQNVEAVSGGQVDMDMIQTGTSTFPVNDGSPNNKQTATATVTALGTGKATATGTATAIGAALNVNTAPGVGGLN